MAKKKKSIGKKLDSIYNKLNQIEKREREEEKEEKKIERKINIIDKENDDIEKIVFNLYNINVRKKHLLEFIRASAGAFLGVGIGRGLLGLDEVAKTLPWVNVLGILGFILILSTLLIYKDEKRSIDSKGTFVVVKRLLFIYFIAIIIEFISLILFNVNYESPEVLAKIIIVGSYTAVASAITFSLSK